MRKTLRSCLSFIGLASLLSTQNALAQNGTPYWSTLGNSNATSSSKLGTTNAINLRLYTNNVERMRITTSGLVGIGTTAPNARLHFDVPVGTSLLRGTVAGVTKLYMSSAGGLTVGAGLAAPANGLYVAGNAGIGTATPSYKLHVVSSGTAIYGNSTSGGIGVYGNSNYTGVFGHGSYGVWGGSDNGYGVYGLSSTSYVANGSTGVYGSAYYGVYGYSSTNTGVYGKGAFFGVYGYNNTGDYAVYGRNDASSGGLGVVGDGGINGYGVYGFGGIRGVYAYNSSGGSAAYAWATAPSTYAVSAISDQSIGVYAYTGNTSSYAGYFLGKVYSSGGYSPSDRNLKQDIQDLTNALDIIQQLQPKYYSYRQDGNYKYMNLPQGKQYGLIAQDVEQILPNLVSETQFDVSNIPTDDERPEFVPNPDGSSKGSLVPKITVKKEKKEEVISFKAINYNELIPILIKGMQEQEQKINTLQAMVDKLVQERGTNAVTGLGTLSQNTPNPAKTSTRISYSLPANTSRAQLLLTDAGGKTIKTIVLNGSGFTNLNTGALSSGIYNYSLVVDGVVVDTKRLTITR